MELTFNAMRRLVHLMTKGLMLPRLEDRRFKDLRIRAEANDLDSQVKLAQSYLTYGSHRDPARALHWYEKAAEGGSPIAQMALAKAYREGVTITKDSGLARTWYLRAAHGGAAEARFVLGQAYETGELGLRRDPLQARQWYLEGAVLDHGPSLYRLGTVHSEGIGIVQDLILAHMWFDLATQAGMLSAYRVRDQIIEKMTSSQWMTAKALTAKWPEIKASNGRLIQYYRGLL